MSLDWGNLETPAEAFDRLLPTLDQDEIERFSPEVRKHELPTKSLPDRTITIKHQFQYKGREITTWFDLNEQQVNFVSSTRAGEDEDGYSGALVEIDQERWFPLRIRASDYEAKTSDGNDDCAERGI